MSAQENPSLTNIDNSFVMKLDSSQLIDLLNLKTQHLISAKKAGVQDPIYLNNLREEVERIQSELRARNK